MAKNENQTVETLTVQNQNDQSLVFDTIEHFENAMRMCKCLATAGMLPQHFRGDQNIGNCMLALEVAQRGGRPIMEVFQNMFVVNGKTSWGSSYLIGRVNTSGRFSQMEWDEEGAGTQNWRMRAKCRNLLTGKELIGAWVSIQMARDFKWGDMWNKMPEQMLRYRSAAFWVRAYAPDIACGIPMKDEVEDATYADVTPQTAEEREDKHNAAVDALKNAFGKKKPEDVKPEEEQHDQPEMPTPIVQIKVETPSNNAAAAADDQPKTGKDNPYLQQALKNMGLNKHENGGQLDFESSEQ